MSKYRVPIVFQILLLVSYVWLLFNWKTVESGAGFTLCYFKNIFDLPCPTCGTTRSLVSLLHGDVVHSLWLNPLGMVAACLMIISQALLAMDYVYKRQRFVNFYEKLNSMIARPPLLVIVVVSLLSNWIWNITKAI